MFKSLNQSAILNWKKIERNRLIKRIREEFQFSNSGGSIFKIISRRLLYNFQQSHSGWKINNNLMYIIIVIIIIILK